MKTIYRLAAFSDGRRGGNPAGVVLLDTPLDVKEMARIAVEIGYSETAFAVRQGDDNKVWQVRYFSPESEVPFCGHATIALGATLGSRYGDNRYHLRLNHSDITVETAQENGQAVATLTSPPTNSRIATQAEVEQALALFNLHESDLDPRLAPARIHGGADHLLLPLKNRETLSAMHYSLDAGRTLMRELALVTIMLVVADSDTTFHARNAFASGGVLEDPATGAAAAAFAGYLRDCHWPHNYAITIHQGDDMGAPSRIQAAFSDEVGSPVWVSGTTRELEA